MIDDIQRTVETAFAMNAPVGVFAQSVCLRVWYAGDAHTIAKEIATCVTAGTHLRVAILPRTPTRLEVLQQQIADPTSDPQRIARDFGADAYQWLGLTPPHAGRHLEAVGAALVDALKAVGLIGHA